MLLEAQRHRDEDLDDYLSNVERAFSLPMGHLMFHYSAHEMSSKNERVFNQATWAAVERVSVSENNDIVIRPFRLDDQAAAQRLIVTGLAEHFGFLDPTANPDLDDIASTYADGTFLLAWQGDELVGTGALIHEKQGLARIVRMSVAPHLRRQGIGTLILERLCEQARAAGYRQIVLETTATWDDVIAFYRRNGFRVIGSWDGDTHFVLDLDSPSLQ